MPPDSRRTAFLVRLFHHRWAPAVAAAVAASSGSRFVALQMKLGTNPASLKAALQALLDLGLVRRNPGFGHPLRPEYLSTAAGKRLGPPIAALLTRLRSRGIEGTALRKWSMPLLDVAASGATRFHELQAALPGVTPRALAGAVKDLIAAGLIRREIGDGYPPIPFYRVTAEGTRVARLIRRIG